MRLRIWAFGRYSIDYDDHTWSHFRSDKSRGLLLYLALSEGQPVRRETLATLLWPEASASAARTNLRVSLHDLRKGWKKTTNRPHSDFLTTDRKSITLNQDAFWCDVTAFQALVTQDTLEAQEEAAELLSVDLLPGFTFPDAEGLNQWLDRVRSQTSQQAVKLLEDLCLQHNPAADPAKAMRYADKLLEFNPWRELTWRILFESLGVLGDMLALDAAYARCLQMLRGELGVEPERKTVDAYEAARQQASLDDDDEEAIQPLQSIERPIHLDQFFGRNQEIAQLQKWLDVPTIRLITIVGIGGAGKTRLALRLAEQPTLTASSYFVGLHAIQLDARTLSERLASLTATAMGIELQSDAAVEAQLFKQLRSRDALLIYDNLEHLPLGALRGFFHRLLAAAPNIKLVVTSRERLYSHIEQVLRLQGLDLPQRTTKHLTASASVKLFLKRAARADASFQPDEAELRDIAAICRLVGGLPLAIELAASWIEHYTSAEIVEQIAADVGFLEARNLSLPVRHTSMRKVYDYSWALLTPRLRERLLQLAIFPGQFSRDAARTVTSVTMADLADLVDRSLLQMVRKGVYALHPLLRQFSAEAQPTENHALFGAYADYFIEILVRAVPSTHWNVVSSNFSELLPLLTDLDLIWRWCAKFGEEDRLNRLIGPLYVLLYLNSRFHEARELFDRADRQLATVWPAATRSPEQTLLLASTRTRLAALSYYCGDVKTARKLGERAVLVVEAAADEGEMLYAYSELISIYYQVGEHERVLQTAQKKLPLARKTHDKRIISSALNSMGRALNYNGRYVEAHDYYRQAVELDRIYNPGRALAIALANLGRNAMYAGDLQASRHALVESLELRQQMGNTHRIASVLNALGQLAVFEGDYALAITLQIKALAGFEEAGRHEAFGLCHFGIAIASLYAGDLAKSREHLSIVLHDSIERQLVSRALEAIDTMGDYFFALKGHEGIEEARQLKRYVETHRNSSGHTRKGAQEFLQRYGQPMDSQHHDKLWQAVAQYCLNNTRTAPSIVLV